MKPGDEPPFKSSTAIQTQNFTVILSRPELPENIGFVARTAHAYGIQELRLVGISTVPADSRAYWTASGGESLLKHAAYYRTLSEALADCRQALGFTRRARGRSLVLTELRDVQKRFEEKGEPPRDGLPVAGIKTALVFGCESDGLSQDEVLLMTHLVRIPLPDPGMSLNLSHAVAIALYALAGGEGKRADRSEEYATLAETQAVLDQVLEVLDANGFLSRGKKDAVRRESARVVWQRIQPSKRELDFLSGALRALAEKVGS